MVYLITAAVFIFGYAVAQDADCDYRQNVGASEQYYFNNPNWPWTYHQNIRCRYIGICPTGYNCRIDCNLSMPWSSGCNGDRVVISRTGDPTLAGSTTAYCGTTSFSAVSVNQQIVMGFFSTNNSQGGRFKCTLYAQQITTTPAPTVCTCGVRKTTRIVGGTETKVNEYTMMAALIERSSDSLRCGASIISSYYVLTAAHCIAPYKTTPDKLLVSIGDHDIENRNPNNQYYIQKFIIHENYNPNTFDYDIGLVKIQKEIIFTQYIQPVCLPFKYTDADFTGRNVTFLGWGLMEPGGMLATGLQKVDVKVIDRQTCTRYQNVTPRQFCTLTPGKDACQFDSGGPCLYEDSTGGLLYQMGIISSGNACASSPGISTDVTVLLTWIINNANDRFCIKR